MRIKNLHNNETFETDDVDATDWSFSYNIFNNETEVYAFNSNVLLFTLAGKCSEKKCQEVFDENWEVT